VSADLDEEAPDLVGTAGAELEREFEQPFDHGSHIALA
jgi:hypothetical protein